MIVFPQWRLRSEPWVSSRVGVAHLSLYQVEVSRTEKRGGAASWLDVDYHWFCSVRTAVTTILVLLGPARTEKGAETSGLTAEPSWWVLVWADTQCIGSTPPNEASAPMNCCDLLFHVWWAFFSFVFADLHDSESSLEWTDDLWSIEMRTFRSVPHSFILNFNKKQTMKWKNDFIACFSVLNKKQFNESLSERSWGSSDCLI